MNNTSNNTFAKTPDEERQTLQDAAVTDLLSGHRLIVNWGTGVGKSRVAIRCAVALREKGIRKMLLLVDQDAHKGNWRREFVKALGERAEEVLSGIVIECYASLPKYAGSQWDFIIADEAHHLRSENRIALLASLKADYMLCLSATISCRGDGEDLLRCLDETFGEFKNIDFTVQQAIDCGILGTPRIYVHVLPLEKISVPQTILVNWGPSKKRIPLTCSYEERKKYMDRSVYPAASLSIQCTSAQAYEYYNNAFSDYKKSWQTVRKNAKLAAGDPDTNETMFAKNRVVRCGSDRKIALGRAKTIFAASLVRQLEAKGRKFICFCSDVNQAREIGGENVIYNQRHDNDKVIDAFNEGRIRSLFAVNMIQEGQNLAGIEAGVVLQLGGKERQFIQKFGRALRARCPEQHIVVINNTHDVDFYRRSVEGINKKYIKIIKY